MKKSELNALLAENFNFETIKFDKDYSGFETGSHRVGKGIKVASHSPMDCTSAASNRAGEKLNAVKALLKKHLKVVDNKLILSENSRSREVVQVIVDKFATYDSRMKRDPGYKTSWVRVITFKETK